VVANAVIVGLSKKMKTPRLTLLAVYFLCRSGRGDDFSDILNPFHVCSATVTSTATPTATPVFDFVDCDSPQAVWAYGFQVIYL
jgi:hypothetical protein